MPLVKIVSPPSRPRPLATFFSVSLAGPSSTSPRTLATSSITMASYLRNHHPCTLRYEVRENLDRTAGALVQ